MHGRQQGFLPPGLDWAISTSQYRLQLNFNCLAFGCAILEKRRLQGCGCRRMPVKSQVRGSGKRRAHS